MQHTPLQIKNILKEIAIEKGLSYDLVEEIYYHEFEFLRDAMEKGIKGEADTFNNILLKYLGTFYSNRKQILKLKEIEEKKNISKSE